MQNFFTIGKEVTVPLDLTGLVLISGNNLDAAKADSNGVGKSSSIAGITYAAWGQCPNGLEADDVVHNQVNKDCKVILNLLDDDGTPIQITRTRKDSKAAKANDLILLVGNIDLSASTVKETQVKIDNILGMDFHTFCAMMPGCGVKIATMTDKEVKSLLEKILRTEELSEAHKLANDRYKDEIKTIAVEQAKLNSAKAELANSRVRLMGYENHRDTFELTKIKSIDEARKTLETKVSEEANCLITLLKLGHRGDDADDFIPKEQELEAAAIKAQTAVTELSEKLMKANRDYTKKSSELSTEQKLLKASLDKFSSLAECPTCFSEVCDDHKEKIKSEMELKSNTLTDKQTKLSDNYSKLKNAYDRKMKAAKIAHKEAFEALGQHQDWRKGLESKQREHALLNRAADKAKVDVENAKIALAKIEAQENQFFQLCISENAVITELESTIRELQLQLLEKTKHSQMLKFWVDSFSPSGIRSHMLTTVIPYLNERAAHYCNILTAGEMSIEFNTKTSQKSGKVAEKFSILVQQAHGSHTWQGSSGGEKARADLVISLALADLASLRSTKKLKWRAVDEALDPIDTAGDQAVIELLSQMSNTADSIYIISHKDSLKKQIPTEIVMAKKNSFSYLQEIITDKDVH